MKVIKSNEAIKCSNSDKCKTMEYSFNESDLDLAVATIIGRYPDVGYCVNEISKELIYVLDGEGKLVFENNSVEFSKGDSVLVYPNEKYYWDCDYCVVSLTCNPAWTKDQHKYID